MYRQDYERVMSADDWELQYCRNHKADPESWPLDVIKCRKYLDEELVTCESGICLGEGWHGGMTSEQWSSRKCYIERVIQEMT